MPRSSEEKREYHRQYYRAHKEKWVDAETERRQPGDVRDRYLVYQRQYRQDNLDRLNEYDRVERKTPAMRAKANERRRRRYRSDPQFRIGVNLRNRLNETLRLQGAKRTLSALEIIGCSVEELRVHLEGLFKPGMTWENGRRWHIDHIRPCCSFDLTDPEQQRACFHYTNLRPLWKMENCKKIPMDSKLSLRNKDVQQRAAQQPAQIGVANAGFGQQPEA